MWVRARTRLSTVGTDFARRRDHIGEWPERTIWVDREYSHPRTIANDDVTVARVRREVGRIVTVGRLLVEESDMAARLVDRVGRDFCAVAVNRIEKFLFTIECDELWVGHSLKRL